MTTRTACRHAHAGSTQIVVLHFCRVQADRTVMNGKLASLSIPQSQELHKAQALCT